MLHITLPWPPSLNRYWAPLPHGRGMMLTKDARTYRKLAAEALWKVLGRRTDDPLMTVPVRLDVELRAPDRRARDLDNHLKAIQDVLTNYNVWGDDSQVDELTVRRGKVFSGGQAIIMITELT